MMGITRHTKFNPEYGWQKTRTFPLFPVPFNPFLTCETARVTIS